MSNSDITNELSGKRLPLGSADWFSFPKDYTPVFDPKAGDLFLSRTLEGHAVGLRDDRHVSICAGTRAEKGVSIIIPNLLIWRGSVVVIDPKGENAIVTARRRGSGSRYAKGLGQKVYMLDPLGEVRTSDDDFADLKASFNPLDLLGVNIEESIENAARIADSLIDADAAVSDPFWNEAARDLIAGVILHVVSADVFEPHERNLVTVRRLISEGEVELRNLIAANDEKGRAPTAFALLFRAMSRNKAFDGEVSMLGERFARIETGDGKLLESIAQVACTNLYFLASSKMRKCVSSSSFSLDELKTDPRGVSLYLCLPQRFMNTHFRFLRMMTTMIITEMERVKEQPRSGYPILMVLDEFAGLKKMTIIENAAAQIAGFGVKMMFVVQTLAQLKQVYKDNWETLLANCGVKLFFGNDDQFTREYVSKLVGPCEVVRQTASISKTQGSSASQTSGVSNAYNDSHSVGTTSSMNHGGSRSDGMQFSVSHSVTQTSGLTMTLSESRSDGINQSSTHGTNETLHKRDLVTPDEVGRIFGNRKERRALAILSGHQPMHLKRLQYYNEMGLLGAFDPHPDHPKPPTLDEIPAIKKRQRAEAAQRQEERRRYEAEKRHAAAERAREREEERQREHHAELERKRRARNMERERQNRELAKRRRWYGVFAALAAIAGLFLYTHTATTIATLGILYCSTAAGYWLYENLIA